MIILGHTWQSWWKASHLAADGENHLDLDGLIVQTTHSTQPFLDGGGRHIVLDQMRCCTAVLNLGSIPC